MVRIHHSYGLIFVLVLWLGKSAISKGQLALKDQLSQPRQLAVGINDTYYGVGTVAWKRWQITGQRSFFASKLKSQYWLLNGGYALPYQQASLFAATLHVGGKFTDAPIHYAYAGLSALGTYKQFTLALKSYLPLMAAMPVRYAIELQWEAWQEHLFLTGAFKPHPFLGNPQQYISMGILFKEKHLQVKPTYQIPDDFNGKQMQLLISFYYNFW